MEQPTCATCPHWFRPDEAADYGECRRHPPQATGMARVELPCNLELRPLTLPVDACGDHPSFPDWLIRYWRGRP